MNLLCFTAMNEAWELIRKALRPERWIRMQAVLDNRLGSVRVVAENVHDPHNLSAVLRTAEALGVQHVHVVEADSGFRLSRRISRGAHKWLSLHRYATFAPCADELKGLGFRLYAALLEPAAVSLEEIPTDQPVALVFGNEKDGVGAEARSHCDGTYTIPMTGFVQSFNISVAAAISLYSLSRRMRETRADRGLLDAAEQTRVLESWLPKSLRCGRKMLRAAECGSGTGHPGSHHKGSHTKR